MTGREHTKAVATKRKKPNTADEYLALEASAAQKSEYYQGVIYAMSGASANHNRSAGGMYTLLRMALRGRGCEVFTNDMRLLVEVSALYTYPDGLVVCGGPRFMPGRDDTITNPVIIYEVLSPSSQDYDHRRKFEMYRTIATLRDYVLIHQDRAYIEYFHKQEDGRWILSEFAAVDDRLVLHSIGIELGLHDIYEGVDWLVA